MFPAELFGNSYTIPSIIADRMTWRQLLPSPPPPQSIYIQQIFDLASGSCSQVKFSLQSLCNIYHVNYIRQLVSPTGRRRGLGVWGVRTGLFPPLVQGNCVGVTAVSSDPTSPPPRKRQARQSRVGSSSSYPPYFGIPDAPSTNSLSGEGFQCYYTTAGISFCLDAPFCIFTAALSTVWYQMLPGPSRKLCLVM